MALKIDSTLTPKRLLPAIDRLFELSAAKITALDKTWRASRGAPVITVRGRYTERDWTDWTQGFHFGSALVQYDATGERRFLDAGRRRVLDRMTPYLTHTGVHDHGFNIISTYGNLWRLIREGRAPGLEADLPVCELALKTSGAVQAARWTPVAGGLGFIYSFNGPHSLLIDTMRSMRTLAVAHQLGHVLLGERDRRISLLDRLIEHAKTTAAYCVYYGEGRDAYDVRGRTAQECLFNLNDGAFRCPNTQQGWSACGTWTRGLAWGLLGFAEQLEFFETFPARFAPVRKLLLRAATAEADFYLANCCADGIPMWDTCAPGLVHLGDYLDRPADPFNRWEPVDSSAATVAAQGLIRLGNHLIARGDRRAGKRYRQAGLTVAATLFREPYLSTDPRHQGLILHSVYHRPRGWDHVAPGQQVPNGESSVWGDYHARELALLLRREAQGEPALLFFDPARCS